MISPRSHLSDRSRASSWRRKAVRVGRNEKGQATGFGRVRGGWITSSEINVRRLKWSGLPRPPCAPPRNLLTTILSKNRLYTLVESSGHLTLTVARQMHSSIHSQVSGICVRFNSTSYSRMSFVTSSRFGLNSCRASGMSAGCTAGGARFATDRHGGAPMPARFG